MNLHTCTDQVVSDLISSLLPQDSSARQKHVLREALTSLVRLAKSEQMLEMKNNVRLLTGPMVEQVARGRSRSDGAAPDDWQQKFEFMKPQ